MGEKRTIQSIDLESKLADSLSSQRAKIEEKFLRGKKTSASKTSRERILELASMGEVGVAKSLIMQEISEDLENEKLIETMALLETYWSLDSGIYYWCNILTEANPQNIIGKSLNSIRLGLSEKKWDEASEGAMAILEQDRGNWFGLLVAANSHSALGNWEVSSKFWEELSKKREFSIEEKYQFARAGYNARKFSLVSQVEFVIDSEDYLSIKILELIVRANYNLRKDLECVDKTMELLGIDSKNLIGNRFLWRSLVRLGRLSEAEPIIKEFCKMFPFSVEAWESLIEIQLMMDKVEDSNITWKGIRDSIGEDSDGLYTALEVSLRFNWKNRYGSIMKNEAVKFAREKGFAEKIAEINLNCGDIGNSWSVLCSEGIKPMESSLAHRYLRILQLTNTTIEELEAKSGKNNLWVTELVTREILSRSIKKNGFRRKKRCHLISSSLDRGGAERQVAMTLRHLERYKNFDCFLAVHRLNNSDTNNTYLGDLSGLEHKIFTLEEIDFTDSKIEGYEIVRENSELFSLLGSSVKLKLEQLILHFSKFKPDLVHAWQDETILTSCLAGALTGIPVILGSARSLRPDEKTDLHLRKMPYLRNCFKEIFNCKHHHLSTNSIAGKKSYCDWIGLSPESVIVNENGVDFSNIEAAMDYQIVRERVEKFGFEDNTIIGGLFRLEPGKRPELWIDSFEVARKIDPTIRGIIVGGGRMENSVKEWVKNAGLEEFVKIVGQSNDVGSWLSAMDVFLFTSVAEGLPNVLIEAQGFGVPVVSTNVGGVSEVILDGETGILVNSQSKIALGEAVINIIKRKDFLEIGKSSRINAREKFSVEGMALRTVEMYSRILALEETIQGQERSDG